MRSSWFPRFLVLFLVVPIAELALLSWVGERVGFWPTVGLIVLTAVIGSSLAKHQGLSVFVRFQNKLASGSVPDRELTEGLIILISAVLLLTPGIITDAFGFLGLLPPTRALIRTFLQKRFSGALKSDRSSGFVMSPGGAFTERSAPIEDAEIIEETTR